MGRDDGEWSMECEMSGEEKDDFLSSMMAQQPAETAHEADDEPKAEPPKVEAVAEVKAEAPKVETTATESEAGKNVPLAALMAEREKRQEAARKAEELERRIKELEGEKPAQTLPDFFQNPEAYVQTAIQAAQMQAKDSLYAALEEAERERHADFDDVMAFVMDKAKENPAIAAEILKGKNPAAQAYKVGKRLQDFDKSMQDPDSYRAQLKAELLAELKKEQELESLKKQQAAAKEKAIEDSIPPDLSSERSANGQFSPRRTSSVVDTLFPKT